KQDLARLNQLLVDSENPELLEEGKKFQDQIAELERQPRSASNLYPKWVNPILEMQAHLDSELQLLVSKQEVMVGADKKVACQLQLDVQRLLLYYQTQSFGSLAIYLDELKAGDPSAIDGRVLDAFGALRHSANPTATSLARLQAKYEFVRPHLLDKRLELVPSGAAYYLGQIGDVLGREARNLN
ncbi:hypothetical protein, partial [Pseudomonas aeruginosa]|uniref:hypothetical protein n=1 Tax=Pseudomonas aeruginosa TaxID=287 RepID=UPI00163C5867